MTRFRALLVVACMLGAGTGAMVVAAPAASAAGSGYSGKAVYQITIANTCNSVVGCGAENLGGFWGWIALFPDGTGDGQITFCGHGAGGSGAGHEALTIGVWSIDNGYFAFSGASDPHFDADPTRFPATPGHYNIHPVVGWEIEVTVALNPTA